MRKSVLKVLVGFSCLPTATKFQPLSPTTSNAFTPNQYQYILESTSELDLKGGPVRVVLTTFEPLMVGEGDDAEIVDVGFNIATKHFSEKKNLPSRKVITIIDLAGTVHGEPVVKGTSLPHWELMVEGMTKESVQARIEANRSGKMAPKQLALSL